jgi:transposase-like protein
MTKSTRRKFTPEMKARICIEMLREEEEVGTIADKYGIHGNVLRAWKKQFLEQASAIFEDKRKKAKDKEADEAELYKQIGQMKVENDWLKKKLGPLGLI